MPHHDNVHKYFEAYLGHIPRAERERLDGGPLVVHNHEYGWWIWVPPDDNEPYEHAARFPELTKLLKIARAMDCRFVCLDSDGDAVEGLPVYED